LIDSSLKDTGPNDAGLKRERLRINEIFHSLQGEADAVGYPTVFVRLTGCPLRCQYCDTEYAFHAGDWYDLDTIVDQVGSWSYAVVISVYIFDRTHSTQWLAAFAACRWGPSLLVASYGGVLADRRAGRAGSVDPVGLSHAGYQPAEPERGVTGG